MAHQYEILLALRWTSQHCGTKIGHDMSPKYGLNFGPREETDKWNIPCHIRKQGCHSHYQLQPSYESQWALRELRREKNPCQLAAVRLQPLSVVSSEERKPRVWSHRAPAPASWGACERNDFNGPRLLHLPRRRKTRNSLNRVIWFSLTIIFWGSDSLLLVAKFLNELAPPLTSLERFSQGRLRCCLLGLQS